MQSSNIAIKPVPSRWGGARRRHPWRHRVGLGGRDRSARGSFDRPWLTRTAVLLAVFLISTLLYITSSGETGISNTYETDSHSGRHLLSNASHNKPAWEQCEYEKANLPGLWVAFYAFAVLVLFIAIAIICDDFFVPSLEAISEKLELSEDVAGATFMAAGSSAPELFTSVVGVAFESDVGVGTIVGSAMFNILIIIALTAALAGKVLHLDWRPLARDSIFYLLSIACYIIFSWDVYITWWEALLLLILYIIYLVLMKFNPKIMAATDHITCGGFCQNDVAPLDEEAAAEQTPEAVTAQPAEGNTAETTAEQKGNALPRKLPPLQHTANADVDRKISVLSSASTTLAVPNANNKHIFHHVKHGELSSNFTSSSYDLRKLARDSDSRASSRPNSSLSKPPVGSRPASQSSFVNGTSKPVWNSNNGDVNSNSIPMTKTNGSVSQQNLNAAPNANGRANIKNDLIVGDVESLGGESQVEYGSQTQLLSVPNGGLRDSDSGIHSAQRTPVIPDTTDPPSDPSSDPNDPKRRMSLIDGHHHHHHHHHEDGKAEENGHAQDGEKKEEEEEEEEEPTLRPIPCFPAINMYYPDKEILADTCGCLRYALKWVLFIISFPFMCCFTWTIPNCSLPHLRKYYIASFLLSIFWIAALSFGMVTLVIKMGCILNVNEFTMGLVIVAIGTSVPDALSSILVARDGYGDMAVSNAIGSNVFDINLGLGLPFLIRVLVKGENMALLGPEDMIRYEDGWYGPMPPHAKFGFILILVLFLTIVTFTAVRFRLNAVVGVSFAAMYVLFLVYAFIQELLCEGSC
ncbi:sodium/potassium/calcium exchanger 1-like [Diadema antillarum]|uniref:sodium/potassium/calcium exchanger 1-like n=1 Tax=Diadema antillarum TaxID=105358 RepID=UPI003A8420B0